MAKKTDKKITYGQQVSEMKEFYKRRLDFASSFRLPGFDEKDDEDGGGDKSSSGEDSSSGEFNGELLGVSDYKGPDSTKTRNPWNKSGGPFSAGIKAKIKSTSVHDAAIKEVCVKEKIDPMLVKVIIMLETAGNPKLISSDGAGSIGLMQITPGNVGVAVDASRLKDARYNIEMGIKIIRSKAGILKSLGHEQSVKNIAWAWNGVSDKGKFYRDAFAEIYKGFGLDPDGSYTKINGVKKGSSKSGGGGGEVKKGAAKSFINKWLISADFPRYPDGSYHSGIDFAGTAGSIRGTKLPCFHAGTVFNVAFMGNGYGNYIVIKTPDNHYHYYAHLDATYVKKGDKVKVDQIIGLVGHTGRSTGAHLHYEVRPSNNRYNDALNPRKFLKGTNKA